MGYYVGGGPDPLRAQRVNLPSVPSPGQRPQSCCGVMLAPVAGRPLYEIDGVTDTVRGHALRAGLNPDSVARRVRRGRSLAEALSPLTRHANTAWAKRAAEHYGRPTAQVIRDCAAGRIGSDGPLGQAGTARRLGCSASALKRWLANRGIQIDWPKQRPRPCSNWKLISYGGVADTVVGHARRLGHSPATVRSRMSRDGWTLAQALATPRLSRAEVADRRYRPQAQRIAALPVAATAAGGSP